MCSDASRDANVGRAYISGSNDGCSGIERACHIAREEGGRDRRTDGRALERESASIVSVGRGSASERKSLDQRTLSLAGDECGIV